MIARKNLSLFIDALVKEGSELGTRQRRCGVRHKLDEFLVIEFGRDLFADRVDRLQNLTLSLKLYLGRQKLLFTFFMLVDVGYGSKPF